MLSSLSWGMTHELPVNLTIVSKYRESQKVLPFDFYQWDIISSLKKTEI